MGQYEYINSTTGKLKVKNVVGYFDKKKGEVRFDFDIRALDISGNASPHITYYIKDWNGVTRESSIIETAPLDRFTTVTMTWKVYDDFDLVDYGDRVVTLQIDDEDDNSLTYNITMRIDLDPVEHNLTITNHTFGNDSTPEITFTLGTLFKRQYIEPKIVLADGTETTVFRIYPDGLAEHTPANKWNYLNGIPIGDITANCNWDSDKTYFKEITSFKIVTSPYAVMSEGLNDFTIDLRCTQA